MGNTNTTASNEHMSVDSSAVGTRAKIADNLSNVSLNGSNKLNTSWKFSTLNDEENDNGVKTHEKRKLLQGKGHDDENDRDENDDEKYDSTCEDTEEIKTKLNLNSILHIDDHADDDGIGFEHHHHHHGAQQQQQYQNLSTTSSSSSTNTSTPSASSESSSSSPQVLEERSTANDTIENLAFNLLNKLTFDGPSTNTETTMTTTTATTVTATLRVPEEPVPPPGTPVTPVTLGEEEQNNGGELMEKLLGTCKNKPQLIIDDVLLMSREDGRPLVPLAEPEQSFTSIETVLKDESHHEVTEQEKSSDENQESAFMTLVHKIAPLSHLIEYRFEFEVAPEEVDYVHHIKVTGSFNNWQQLLSMSRDPAYPKTKWFKNLMLAPGEYEFKYVINDNDWRCNPKIATNGLNNHISLIKN